MPIGISTTVKVPARCSSQRLEIAACSARGATKCPPVQERDRPAQCVTRSLIAGPFSLQADSRHTQCICKRNLHFNCLNCTRHGRPEGDFLEYSTVVGVTNYVMPRNRQRKSPLICGSRLPTRLLAKAGPVPASRRIIDEPSLLIWTTLILAWMLKKHSPCAGSICCLSRKRSEIKPRP